MVISSEHSRRRLGLTGRPPVMSTLYQCLRVRVLGVILLGLMASMIFGAETSPRLVLTEAEKAWLAAHPVIRVGYDPTYRPFCFRDNNGGFAGIDAGVLAYVAAQAGVRFEFVTGSDWSEIYHRAQRREVDMLTSTAATPEREQQFLFTRDYIKVPVTVVTRSDGPFAVTVSDLADMRVAAVPNYAPTEVLKRENPGMELVSAKSVDEAMLMVSRGDADAVVTNLVNASFIIKAHGFANLKIAGVIPQTFETRFAIRRDWPEWNGILERILATMQPQEMARILDPWIHVDYAALIRWDVVRRWGIIGSIFVLTIVTLVLWRNQDLQRELEKRRTVLSELEAANGRLHAANVELTVRHEEKTHLLQVAAHDLRNPLTGMMLTIDTLRGGECSSAAEPLLDRLGRTAQQMTRLIDDLLAVDALESGRWRLTLEPVDVAAALRRSVETFQSAAVQKRIELVAKIPEALPAASGDRRGLSQILDNLLSNALKFSPKNSCVTATLVRFEESVRIEIADQGPGVAESEREKIFVKFARGSARPTGGETSTGLGLAIVRELTVAMNGRVWCEATPERGTVFIVQLPIHQTANTSISVLGV